jgi:hypothetical protein
MIIELEEFGLRPAPPFCGSGSGSVGARHAPEDVSNT